MLSPAATQPAALETAAAASGVVDRPPNVPPRKKPPTVGHLPYYYSHLKSMHELHEMMLPYLNTSGCFILRNSFSKVDAYTVTVMHKRVLYHFHIMDGGRGQFFLRDHKFPSIEKLIRHYADEDIPNTEGVKDIRLTFSVEISPKAKHSVVRVRNGVRSEPLPDSESPTTPRRALPTSSANCEPRGTTETRLPQLLALLEEEDRKGAERCDCGLLASEAQLPCGWTMHLSREQVSRGRLFFMSPEEKTAWKLPQSVEVLLTDEEKERLKRLEKEGAAAIRPVRPQKGGSADSPLSPMSSVLTLSHPAPVITPSQPASVLTPLQPAAALTSSQPTPILTSSQPAPDLTSQPASVLTPSQPVLVLTQSQPAPVLTPSQPVPVLTPSQPASVLKLSQAPPVLMSQPASVPTPSQPVSYRNPTTLLSER